MTGGSDTPLLHFVKELARLCNTARDERALLAEVRPLMRQLVSRDDWLPPACAASDPQRYQQHLLYADPLDRFSLVSFVWGPGQSTPVHDHTVWGVIGMLRGAEESQAFGQEGDELMARGAPARLAPGDVEAVSPRIGDIHQVRNAYDDRVSISIHAYGGNIGRIHRHVYAPPSLQRQDFVSGYSNALVPNLWHGATH